MTQIEPLQVTMDVAAELTSISRRTLDEMIAAGQIASNKIGRRRYIPMSEIRRLTLAAASADQRPIAGAVAGLVEGAISSVDEFKQQNQRVTT